MMDSIETFAIKRITREGKKATQDMITKEIPLTVILNNRELVTLLCSPAELKYLAIGFLASEGLVKGKDEINGIIVDDQRGVVRVETKDDRDSELIFKRFITSGCGRGTSFYSAADIQDRVRVESKTVVSAPEVFALVKEFQRCSRLYRATGGVHSAALCDTDNILVFSEDIGRHNAIDKIFGRCLLEDITTNGQMIITSGRVSSEILLKVARRNIPIIISKSAPTDLGVALANDFGITLIGFARGKRMNAYTNDWRIVTDEKIGVPS